MASIKCNVPQQSFVHIPYWFITDYMPKALSGDLKVYLYLFALAHGPGADSISLEEVSSKIGMLYSELLQALYHWDKKKVLKFVEHSPDQFELEFYLDSPSSEVSIPQAKVHPKTIISQTRPEYRTEEINLYLQDSPDIGKLFKICEQYLGRMLTMTDQKVLYSLYDWLHMPFDLIEFLVEYCAMLGKTSIRYIESVAISWVDEGITSLVQAKEKVALDKRYFAVLKALGSSKSKVTPVEKSCIDKWLTNYKFNMNIILEACNRAVMNANKPSLNYVDSILNAWHTAQVKTLDDIKALDKAHESKKFIQNSSSSQNTSMVSPKITKFNNMYSRDWDFDELEKLEREYITRKLNGGK